MLKKRLEDETEKASMIRQLEHQKNQDKFYKTRDLMF